MRLLMIEDNPQFAASVKAGMNAQFPHYDITHCSTLRSASAQLKLAEFDAALIDLGLPDAQDADVVNSVKALAPELPLVALTGKDFEDLGANLLRLGIQDYLQKGDVSLTRIDQCLRMACERQNREETLRKRAAFDPLTGLANRTELAIQLRRALTNAERQQLKVAVIAIDLDGFKGVNDRHGHATGDSVLQYCARRLLRWVRASDCVARVGGDEFIVVLESVKSLDDAIRVAEKLRDQVAKPIACDDRVCSVTASIGIAMYPEHGTTGDVLCRRADEAMYLAKRSENGEIRVFEMPAHNNAETASRICDQAK